MISSGDKNALEFQINKQKENWSTAVENQRNERLLGCTHTRLECHLRTRQKDIAEQKRSEHVSINLRVMIKVNDSN